MCNTRSEWKLLRGVGVPREVQRKILNRGDSGDPRDQNWRAIESQTHGQPFPFLAIAVRIARDILDPRVEETALHHGGHGGGSRGGRHAGGLGSSNRSLRDLGGRLAAVLHLRFGAGRRGYPTENRQCVGGRPRLSSLAFWCDLDRSGHVRAWLDWWFGWCSSNRYYPRLSAGGA